MEGQCLWSNSSQRRRWLQSPGGFRQTSLVSQQGKSSYSRNQNGTKENSGAEVKRGHQDAGTLASAGHGDKAVCMLTE